MTDVGNGYLRNICDLMATLVDSPGTCNSLCRDTATLMVSYLLWKLKARPSFPLGQTGGAEKCFACCRKNRTRNKQTNEEFVLKYVYFLSENRREMLIYFNECCVYIID